MHGLDSRRAIDSDPVPAAEREPGDVVVGGRTQAAGSLPDALWHDLVAACPEAMIVTDADLVCRFASASIAELGGARPEELVGLPLARIIHREDWDGIVRATAALEEGAPMVHVAARVLLHDGEWHVLDARARRIERAEEVWIVLTARDGTVDRRNASALARRIELEALLEAVQRRFIHVENADAELAISWALESIGRHLGASRAFVVRYDLEARTETVTDEWFEDGLESELGTYADVPFDVIPKCMEMSMAGEVIALQDIRRLGPEWEVDANFLLGEGIVSLLEFAMLDEGEAVGSLGFEWSNVPGTWTEEELVGLGLFAGSFAQLHLRVRAAQALESSLEELRMAFEGSPVPLALIDADGTLLRVNEELLWLVGAEADDLIGQFAGVLVQPEHLEHCIEWGVSVMECNGERLPALQAELVTGHGRRVWADIAPRPVRGSDGVIVNFVIRVDDITPMRDVQAALGASEARFATLVDNLPDPVMRVGAGGELLFSNSAARRLLGGSDGRSIIDDDTRRLLAEARNRACETGETQTRSYELVTRLGRRTFETRVVPEVGAAGHAVSVLNVTTDLTERRRGEVELAYQATHDGLTGLPNRAAFLASLRDALLDQRAGVPGQVAVLFFDLDRFKVVNDSLGHSVGDALLVRIAERMSQAVRSTDIVARLGGDEFTVLMTGVSSLASVLQGAERLQAAITEPVELADRELVVSSSIGVALATTGDEQPDEMMQWADAAMYRAKERGRDRISVFDETLAAEVRGRLELDQRLRLALEREEFEVYYQPEVDVSSGRILGAEALLRWRSPTGLVSAADFIDLAEENGLIVPIGAWVLEQACRQTAEWLVHRPDLIMRVNLSARQLDDDGIVELVADVLDRTGVPASSLCLEITETALMADAEASRVLLRRLDALGVILAVDDFGTGYSSLSYLKQFPVDVLKIDRSFVDGIPDDAEDAAIVTTIIRLADTLGMQVTAEGIESRVQAEALASMGCPRGQGFHFARPMPAMDFEAKLLGELVDGGDGGI